jgi:hypothetical protein
MSGLLSFWLFQVAPGLAPIDPGTSDPALITARACAGCHEAETRAWKKSRHAAAWTNGLFQREYQDKPRAWCVNCHAPVAAAAARDDGVGCASCLVREGKIVAARRNPGSPHATVVRPGFGAAPFCGSCHQFDFPIFEADGSVRRYTNLPMQATLAQFLAGPYAGDRRGCRACHDAHAFPGAHDPAMLRRALSFTACRTDAEVVFEVGNVGAGHNVPTGDVHRHVNARVWRASAPEGLYEAFFGRRFEPDDAGGKRTTWDSTIPPRARRRFAVPLASLGGDATEPISFELRYVYTVDEHPSARRDPGEPTFHVIHERRVPFEELSPCR